MWILLKFQISKLWFFLTNSQFFSIIASWKDFFPKKLAIWMNSSPECYQTSVLWFNLSIPSIKFKKCFSWIPRKSSCTIHWFKEAHGLIVTKTWQQGFWHWIKIIKNVSQRHQNEISVPQWLWIQRMSFSYGCMVSMHGNQNITQVIFVITALWNIQPLFRSLRFRKLPMLGINMYELHVRRCSGLQASRASARMYSHT